MARADDCLPTAATRRTNVGRAGSVPPADAAVAPRQPEAGVVENVAIRRLSPPSARVVYLRRRAGANGVGPGAETWGSRGRRFKSCQPDCQPDR